MSVKAPRAHLYWPSEFLLCSYYRARLTFVRSPLNNSPPRRQFKPNVHDPPCDPGKKDKLFRNRSENLSVCFFIFILLLFVFVVVGRNAVGFGDNFYPTNWMCWSCHAFSKYICAAPPCKLPTLALDVVKICALHQRPLARQLDQKVTLTALASHPY